MHSPEPANLLAGGRERARQQAAKACLAHQGRQLWVQRLENGKGRIADTGGFIPGRLESHETPGDALYLRCRSPQGGGPRRGPSSGCLLATVFSAVTANTVTQGRRFNLPGPSSRGA